jgi:hypothetical protein
MTDRMHPGSGGDRPLEVRIGRHELVVRRRYEVLSIINDLLIGVWFTIGSVLFLSAGTTTAGVWLFLIGSIQLLIRPIIRLTRNVHLQRISPAGRGFLLGSSHEF